MTTSAPTKTQARTKSPFPAPAKLPADLARVRDYWRGLLRGGASEPFADDVDLTALPDLAARLFLVDVFDQPERFRFAIVGETLGRDLGGKFLDETDLPAPFDYLRAQCSAAVESREPTFFQGDGYGRLVLPAWGDGRTSLLLGAVART